MKATRNQCKGEGGTPREGGEGDRGESGEEGGCAQFPRKKKALVLCSVVGSIYLCQ